MKKLLLNILLIMLCQTYAFAQYTRYWNGIDVPGHIQASFKELDGTQRFKISTSNQKVRFLKYKITREAGNLTIVIKSGSEVILSKKIMTTAKDSINISNTIKQMKVEIIGDSAAGNFNITYSP